MTSKSAPLGVRNVERPRPLRSVSHIGIPASSTNMTNSNSVDNRRMSAQDVSSVEEVVQLLEQVTSSLGSKKYDKSDLVLIIRLSASLKTHGQHMEMFHRELLDKAQVALRNACKDTTLDIVARLHLLEIIELRAMKWVLTDSVINYYKQKLSMVDCDDPDSLANNAKRTLNVNAPLFTPQSTMGNGGNILDQLLPHQNVSSLIPSGEIMMSSGKYSGPTQPHGKSYFKDEVYIRNADSGKVMGVKGRRVHMIEEMSDTIISFQRVLPGSLDRLVQITGTVPNNVAQAKVLMEDTIRRNQSPLPDGDSHSNRASVDQAISGSSRPTSVSGSGHSGTAMTLPHPGENEYKFSVKVGDDILRISSTNLQLVKSAKILLEEHYTCNIRNLITVSRQPLFPDSTKEAVDLAEMMDGGGHSKQRRENFAKTAQTEAQQPKKNSIERKISYDREFLLKCSQASSCGKTPANWDSVVLDNPDVVKKDGSRMDGKAYFKIPLSVLIPPWGSQKHRASESIVIIDEEG